MCLFRRRIQIIFQKKFNVTNNFSFQKKNVTYNFKIKRFINFIKDLIIFIKIFLGFFLNINFIDSN